MTCYNCFEENPSGGACPHCGYDAASAAGRYPLALRPGSILNGRYIVGRVLGQGGFGITYIAMDDRHKNRVAVKEYFPSEFAGRAPGSCSVRPLSGGLRESFAFGREKFVEEAKTLAAFRGDEHIVRIYNFFEENGTAYFAMEYVEGRSLDKYMAEKGGRLRQAEADRLLLPLMESMEGVHARGIVHRDVAPDNILIQPSGHAKLIDFGAARYSTGEKSKSLDVVIKHGFAPIEQYTSHGRQGPFTDVYAMAASYYYAVTGKIPPESIGRMGNDTIIPPKKLGVKLSSATEAALYKALSVQASERFQTMGDFRRAMGSKPIPAPKPTPMPVPAPKPVPGPPAGGQAGGTREAPQQGTGLADKAKALLAQVTPALKSLWEKIKAFFRKIPDTVKGLLPSSLVGPSRQLAAPGSNTFTFGRNGDGQPIEWLILERKGSMALVVSKYALDCRPYDSGHAGVTWERCALRGWLNSEFLISAFSDKERALIAMTTVSADRNPGYATPPGRPTSDRIFLLSILEADRYFPGPVERKCAPTAYAVQRGCFDSGGSCWWWLRTPGEDTRSAAVIDGEGSLFGPGNSVLSTGNAVRPAMWVSL